jgi:DNA-binding MurR/RpiR family transcriptional regulator
MGPRGWRPKAPVGSIVATDCPRRLVCTPLFDFMCCQRARPLSTIGYGGCDLEAVTVEFAALVQRVADIFSGLSPELRRAARFVLDRPDDVALTSMRGLARDAGVQPATMVRLARAAGFSGYEEFREPFRHRLRDRQVDYVSRARTIQSRGEGSGVPRLLAEVQAATDANVRATFAASDATAFNSAAAALAGSRRVFVAGLRSCFPIAFSFHYGYRMFRDDVRLLDGHGGTFSDGLRGIGSGDALFAVSIDPYTAETVHAVAHAKQRGATVVALTDALVSPLAIDAEHVLLVRCDGPPFFGSLAAAHAVVEALIVVLVANAGGEALQAMERSQRQLEIFRAYARDDQRTRAKANDAGGRSS